MMKKRMDKKEYIKTGAYLMKLIGSVLDGTPVPEAPQGISWELFCYLAEKGAVSAVCFYGIEKLEKKPAKEIYDSLAKKRDLALYRKLHYDIEREEIMGALQKEGISCLPLKGILLADYYPAPGMREMLDNDILYGFVEKNRSGKGYQICGRNEEEKEESVQRAKLLLDRIMIERGYEKDEAESAGHHDAYMKKPMFNFEMHREMVSDKVVSFPYYKEPWRLAMQDKDNKGLFSMSDEDEYIFLISHEYHNHYVRGDSKIRFLADLHVYLKKKGRTMDWEYIKGELKAQRLLPFEKEFRELSEAVSSGKPLSVKQEALFYFLLDNGADSTEKKIDKEVEAKLLLRDTGNGKRAKFTYIWKRICLPKEECKAYYPFFYRHRRLMPILIIYRFFKGLFTKRHRFFHEISSIWKA